MGKSTDRSPPFSIREVLVHLLVRPYFNGWKTKTCRWVELYTFYSFTKLVIKLRLMQGIPVVNKLQGQSSVAQLLAGNNCFLILLSPTIHPSSIPTSCIGNSPTPRLPSSKIEFIKFNSSVLYACNQLQGEGDFGWFWRIFMGCIKKISRYFFALKKMNGLDFVS